MITLDNGTCRLTIVPKVGGGLLKFEAFGRQVLRTGKGPAPGPTDLASFTMLPYCNRIADGQLAHRAALKPNLPKEPHPIHGEGWLSSWAVESEKVDAATLSLVYTPSGGRWPWAFSALQDYRLEGHRFHHTLSVTNRSDAPMPAGLGFHPYFSYRRGDLLKASVRGFWESNDTSLPQSHRLIDDELFWPRGRIDEDANLDHCFTGWDGHLQITRRDITIQVKTSGNLPFLHVYAPAGETFVCLEPVSHVPNALNMMDAPPMTQLPPGETLSASLTYDVSLT